MSRTVSAAAREALYGAQTAEVFLHLLVIDHADLVAPIRLVNNTENIVSAGNTYTAFPFEVNLPPDQEGELPRVQLVVDNVTQLLVEEVRSISSPFTVSLSVVMASAPDTVEAGPFEFEAKSAEYDVQRMVFTLAYESLLQEPFPYLSYTPSNYPGLFQAVDR